MEIKPYLPLTLHDIVRYAVAGFKTAYYFTDDGKAVALIKPDAG